MNSLSVRNKKILVRKIRHYKKLCFSGAGSGARLAEEIGVPQSTVSHWLKGSRMPTAGQLYRLAVAFSVSPFELCGIREKDIPTRSKDDVSLFWSLLDVLEYVIKHTNFSRVSIKKLKSINDIVSNDMQKEFDKG